MAQRLRGLVSQFHKGSDKLKIVKVGHPALRHISRPVSVELLKSTRGKALIEQMVSTMRAHNGCGLAAPQIGRNLQLFIMEITEKDLEQESQMRDIERLGLRRIPLTVIANPKLIKSKKQLVHREGCLSNPDYTALVPRAEAAKIEGINGVTGEPIRFTASKWTARVLQHEVDHLAGKLYIDDMDTRSYAHSDEFLRWQLEPEQLQAESLTPKARKACLDLPVFDPRTN
eukprot:TRINITY_DN11518_c0_g1_i8.p1 TRINITY_DN11518_c0_g1~~TRINITY_DN11518_c0_g1_i8.p1  ORF type:complete len:229 (+),score=16.82 TRINITY_DN11518_c0_g1_i8:288-974(+)